MDGIDPASGTPPSTVHVWMIILLVWIAIFSLLSVGLLLTKNSDSSLSAAELSAACHNGAINGITTNLTRIGEACQDTPAEPEIIPVAIASSPIPEEVTPDKQAAYVAAAFPSDTYTDTETTTKSFPNGTLYTVTHARIGYDNGKQDVSMHFFGVTTLVVVSYTNINASDITSTFDWSMVK